MPLHLLKTHLKHSTHKIELLRGDKTVKSGLLLAAWCPLNTLCWPAYCAFAALAAAIALCCYQIAKARTLCICNSFRPLAGVWLSAIACQHRVQRLLALSFGRNWFVIWKLKLVFITSEFDKKLYSRYGLIYSWHVLIFISAHKLRTESVSTYKTRYFIKPFKVKQSVNKT